MNNEKALANSARGYVKALKETRITIAAVIKDWNICVSQVGMVGTFDFPTTGYTRKAQLIADLERCAAQLDNLASGLTAEGHMILNEEDNREWCGADIEAAHAEALAFNAEVDEVAASEQWDEWANQHDSRKTEAQMIDSDHAEALVMNAAYDVAIKVIADNLSLPVWEGCTETVKREVIKVHHEEARIMNRLIGNADMIPSCKSIPNEIKVYLWGVNERLYPSVTAWDYGRAWDSAIAENAVRRNLKY